MLRTGQAQADMDSSLTGGFESVDEPHPTPDEPLDLLRATALGFATGLRSLMPLALLAGRAEDEGVDIADGGWVLDALQSKWVVAGLRLAALGEVVADKLPFAPSRVDPLPLAARVVLGGTTAGLTSLSEGRASDVGATFGAIGAVIGSFIGYEVRSRLTRRLGLPDLVVALGEDALALSLARWALSR
jgi:uncharacterized membrane protein